MSNIDINLTVVELEQLQKKYKLDAKSFLKELVSEKANVINVI